MSTRLASLEHHLAHSRQSLQQVQTQSQSFPTTLDIVSAYRKPRLPGIYVGTAALSGCIGHGNMFWNNILHRACLQCRSHVEYGFLLHCSLRLEQSQLGIHHWRLHLVSEIKENPHVSKREAADAADEPFRANLTAPTVLPHLLVEPCDLPAALQPCNIGDHAPGVLQHILSGWHELRDALIRPTVKTKFHDLLLQSMYPRNW